MSDDPFFYACRTTTLIKESLDFYDGAVFI
jgi:hypothetical protein